MNKRYRSKIQNSIFQVKAKTKNNKSSVLKAINLLVLGVAMLYCVVMPEQSGITGKWFAKQLGFLFGKAAIVLAVFLIVFFIELFKFKKIKALRLVVGFAIFLASCALLSMIGFFQNTNYGGRTGVIIRDFFMRLFGPAGATVVLSIVFIYTLSVFFNISLLEVFRYIFKSIGADLKEWQSTKEKVKKTKSERVVVSPKRLVQPEATSQIPRVAPRIIEQPKSTLAPQETTRREKNEKPKVEKAALDKSPAAAAVDQKQIEAYKLPPLDLLATTPQIDQEYKHEVLIQKAAILEQTLASFGVLAKVNDIVPGPTVTRFDLTPDTGVKIQQITILNNDLAMAMRVPSIRMVVPVPGKGAVGVEIPNPKGRIIGIREIFDSNEFQSAGSKLSIGLGKTSDGRPVVADIIPMPHLLIAGATGSGKSICIHSILTSILYKARPDEVKFMLIDPKRLELSAYNGLPHIYDPTVSPDKAQVITNPKHAAKALSSLVRIMEQRYEKFAKANVRNIDGYNEYAKKNNEVKEFYIVVIIDELADLMLMMAKEVEDNIQRLAQMARAVGIHVLLATQRPSVDVITGVIKANLSSRIAFQVLSKVDSRVILDSMGAEELLGRGDMLFLPTGAPKPERIQGSYVSENEVESIVTFIKKQGLRPSYDEIIKKETEGAGAKDEKLEDYIKEALKLVQERKRVSQDLLKAHFGSSARATDILSRLEMNGFIFKPEGTNKWQINFDKIEEYFTSDK
ncbi:MAG: DNA translocase FtsK [Elusimicrobia bacterium]|nr:DNA translocase FtsK [Elusimicrobiota bacterium]